MKTIRDVIQLSTDYLMKKGISQARYEAEWLLADVLHQNRLQLYLNFDRPLTDSELTLCRERLLRRGLREPLQYIKGEVEFHDLQLKVTKNVLIPRQETEILVSLIAKELEKSTLKDKVLWDLCCGSGCIGISLKKKFPELKIFLSDISQEALLIAKENAQRNGIEVSFLQGNLFEPFLGQKADYIVCNPPYISQSEYENLDPEVREYEPKQALVSGPTGLEIYSLIAQDLKKYLLSQGNLWLEIGYQQADAIGSIFQAKNWDQYKIIQDYSGHNRFIFLENE